MNYTFGDQYYLFTPNKYTPGYYGFSTALIFGLFAGGSVEYPLRGRINSAGFYYEVGTTDKQLASFVVNLHTIRPQDIFSLAIGIKLGIEDKRKKAPQQVPEKVTVYQQP